MIYQVITTAWNVLYEGEDLEEAKRVMEDENGFQLMASVGGPFLPLDDDMN